MKAILNAILSSLYPSYCLYCGEPVAMGKHCCAECQEKLVSADENGTLYAVSRIRDAKALIAVYRYDKSSRQAVFRLKFREDRGAAMPIGDEMAEKLRAYYLAQSILPKHALDLVIPVPMHPRAERRRGYNQSVLLAKRIANRLEIPYSDRILYKCKDTKKQHNISLKERESNLDDAFLVKAPQLVAGKRILLVDDVCTSGNTFAHCTEVLKEAGAKEIICASFLLRKGRWHGYRYPDRRYPIRYRF